MSSPTGLRSYSAVERKAKPPKQLAINPWLSHTHLRQVQAEPSHSLSHDVRAANTNTFEDKQELDKLDPQGAKIKGESTQLQS